MRGHGEKLSRKRQQAIAALIEQPTIKKAAVVVGIGEATLFRWLQDQEFQRVYRDAKRRAVDHAIARLQKASEEAVETLQDIMNDPQKPPSARVTAARIVLETAVRAVELEDLTTRIENLETQIPRR